MGGQPGHGPTQSPGRGPSCLLPPPPSSQKAFIFYCSFFSKVNLGPPQKNSGLNPWSFEFWRYPRLEPRAKLSPPKKKPLAGFASADTFHVISLIKKTSSAIIDLAFSFFNVADSKLVN